MTTATLHAHQVQELDLTLERERRWLIEHIRVLEALPIEPPEDTREARDSVYQESLDEVEDALSRIDHDTYGVCEQCGGGIYPPHLARVPWARYCRQCTVRQMTGRLDGGTRPTTADAADAVREYTMVKALVA